MNTKLITISTLFAWPLLTGCLSDERTIYAICEDNPQICTDIEAKGWCKTERANVIRQREKELNNPENQQLLYDSLNQWQAFSQCIEIAANIKRRDIEDRDAVKETTFLVTLREIERIEKFSRNSQLPEFLYYHWAQDGDQSKINKLIELDSRSKLNSTRMQLMMAAYYGKSDKTKAIASQYQALRLLSEDDLETLDPSLFASLATHFYQEKSYKLAFVWAQIATMAGLKTNKYNSLKRNLDSQQANIEQLEALAEKTYDSIRSMSFEAPDTKL